MGLQLRCHRLQSDAAAEAVGGIGMSTPPNCNSTAAGGPSRPTFAIAIISLRVRAGDKRPPIGTFLQQPALMFAFKGRRAVFYSAAATAPIVGAHSRRQDPKTPVEQALMRGLGTA